MARVYSIEGFDAWNFDTDKVDKRKIKIECPSCKRKFAALCSKSTTDNGHSNVGCPDYDDWASRHKTVCGKCKHEFEFMVAE